MHPAYCLRFRGFDVKMRRSTEVLLPNNSVHVGPHLGCSRWCTPVAAVLDVPLAHTHTHPMVGFTCRMTGFGLKYGPDFTLELQLRTDIDYKLDPSECISP